MVARQTLTLFVWVQILVPQPSKIWMSLTSRFFCFSISILPIKKQAAENFQRPVFLFLRV